MNKRKRIISVMMLIMALLTSGMQSTVYAAEGVKQGTISVTGKDSANLILSETTVQYSDNETAAEALVQVLGADKVEFTHYSFGDMITGIEGVNADDSHYWAFYINGAAAQEGASTYKVQDGDKLSFQYESFGPVTNQPSGDNTSPSKETLPEGTIKTAIDSVTQYVGKQTIGDWEAISLKQLGKEVPASYLENIKQLIKDKKGTFRSITDTEKYTLGILAAGGDPINIEGYNLVQAIYNGDVTKQGLNGVAYGLIALDSANFSVPDNAVWTRDKLVKQVLDKQNQDGGWTWDVSSTTSDLDTTAMVLTALAPYKNQEGVKANVDKALQYISDQFNASKIDNSSTAAQVIIALSALGIDANGSQFTKENTSLVQFFLTFQNADGGFDYTGGDTSDQFSTAFGIEALAAYQLYTEGKGSLYSLPLAPQKPVPSPTTNDKKESQNTNGEQVVNGKPLPDTATNTTNLLILGFILILFGSVYFRKQNQKKI